MASLASAGGIAVSRQKQEGETKAITARVCWMDHPNLRNKLENIISEISGEKLLEEMPHLMTPRNEIVQLPKQKLLTTEFRCAICGEIPFPWRGPKDKDTEGKFRRTMDDIKQGIVLCQEGHSVCRQCFSYFDQCAAQLYLGEASLLPTNMGASSLTNFGQEFVCMAPFALNPEADGYLEKMIDKSEFSCLYYYNFCSFRGKGNTLKNHVENCPYKPRRR